jgi:hypothetical protein
MHVKGETLKCSEIYNEVFSSDKPSEGGVSWENWQSTLGQDITLSSAVPAVTSESILYGHKYNMAVSFSTVLKTDSIFSQLIATEDFLAWICHASFRT